MTRLNEVTFNAPLLSELRTLELAERLIDEGRLPRGTGPGEYRRIRLHRIVMDARRRLRRPQQAQQRLRILRAAAPARPATPCSASSTRISTTSAGAARIDVAARPRRAESGRLGTELALMSPSRVGTPYDRDPARTEGWPMTTKPSARQHRRGEWRDPPADRSAQRTAVELPPRLRPRSRRRRNRSAAARRVRRAQCESW